MFAIVESAGDRNVLLCYSSKKYPPGTASGQGSLIGGSSWRRILYSCRTQVCMARHISIATSNSLNEMLFSLHKQGRHERQCTSCDDKSIHLIHRLYDGVRRSRSHFRRITSEDRTLRSSNGCESPGLRTISRRELPTVCEKQCSKRR
jgi:hypothetical protein